MEYLVFCTFDIEGLNANETRSRAVYDDVYEAMEAINLHREYPVPPRGLDLGMAGIHGRGLMGGMGTTLLTAPMVSTPGDLPSTTVVGRIAARTPLEAVTRIREQVKNIFTTRGLKGRAFVVAATNEECDRFVF